MTDDTAYPELTRLTDPIEADLLAAFLEDGDIDFVVVNRTGAGLMSPLMPRSANPVIFRVLREDYERGLCLLDEYRRLQQGLPVEDLRFSADVTSLNAQKR